MEVRFVETISFSIKSDHPLKVEIIFKKLEDTNFIYFLTFRDEEEFFPAYYLLKPIYVYGGALPRG